MITRDELNDWLAKLYQFEKFDDYCENGLQIEGKEEIHNILLGVSFSRYLLDTAVEEKADAIIVHHGFFGKDFFTLKGHKKSKIKKLLDHDISLFGIHLPMDAHPQIGHNALLFKAIGIGTLDSSALEPFDFGFAGQNKKPYNLDQIIDIFHDVLHGHRDHNTNDENSTEQLTPGPLFSFHRQKDFDVLRNGPSIPSKIAIVSGGAAGAFEKAIAQGVDTFICGEIKEYIPALSYETGTNFINLGHYYSEKPGVLELMRIIDETFEVRMEYVEISNPV